VSRLLRIHVTEDDYLDHPFKVSQAGFMFNKTWWAKLGVLTFSIRPTQSTPILVASPSTTVDDSEGPFRRRKQLWIFTPICHYAEVLLDNLYIDPFDTQAGQELYGFQFDGALCYARVPLISKVMPFSVVSALSGSLWWWDWENRAIYFCPQSKFRAK